MFGHKVSPLSSNFLPTTRNHCGFRQSNLRIFVGVNPKMVGPHSKVRPGESYCPMVG